MVAFGSSFGVPAPEVFGSNLYLKYKNLLLLDRNKLVQAHILRYSLNTLKNHRNNFLKYADFCSGRIFPIDIGHLNSFLLTKAEEGKTYVSIKSFVNSVKFISSFLGYDFPSESVTYNFLFFLRKLCNKTVRSERIGFQKKHVLHLYHDISLNGGLTKLTPLELRSFMLIVFCYCTLARFDCAANIKLENVAFLTDYVHCKVPKSKTDQFGDGQKVFLVNLPELKTIHILAEYIFLLKLDSDEFFLFPTLKWDKMLKLWRPKKNKKLSYSAAYSGFKSLLKRFGMGGLPFSLHSPRIGGTTDAFQSGTPGYVIDKRGRWKNPNSKFVYAKDSDEHLANIVSSYV